MKLVVVDAGVSDPSSTKALADKITQQTSLMLTESMVTLDVHYIELSEIALDIVRSLVSGLTPPSVQNAISELAEADGVILSTPVYKAGISGLLKSFLDLLDNDLLIAKPVLLAATAGTARHSLVIDDQFRSILAFFRALVVPSSVFAANTDWNSSDLDARITRGALELSELMKSGVGHSIADSAWSGYQHQFGGNATRSDQSVTDVDFSTDLMKLATGGNVDTDAPISAVSEIFPTSSE